MLIQKTHYEAVRELFQKEKIFRSFTFEEFISQVKSHCGANPSYGEFIESSFIKHMASSLKNSTQATIFANILYHLYFMQQQHDRLYYVCPKLSLDLAHTELNVDTRFLKSPFPEIYIQIDPGLYYISDSTGEHPVRGLYVNLREEGEKKLIRVMAAALKSTISEGVHDDALFYFRIELNPGKVNEQLQKYIDESISDPKKEQELKSSGGYYNINHLKELFFFVFNVLLYITSKDADIIKQFPINSAAKITRLKSQAKINKILKRQSKVSQLPILIVGSKILSNYPIDQIKNSGGIGKWKLSMRLYISGHWRIQWYGSKDNRRSELIHIKPYEKGPEMANLINSRHYQVGLS